MDAHMLDLLNALQIGFMILPVLILVGLVVGYYRGWKIWEEYFGFK